MLMMFLNEWSESETKTKRNVSKENGINPRITSAERRERRNDGGNGQEETEEEIAFCGQTSSA